MITGSRVVVALAAALALAGCSDGSPAPKTSSTALPLPTLPPGELRAKVLQPNEVNRALVPITAQTGARDITSIASFSADPLTAQRTLQSHGFQSAYVVQYGDPASSAVVTNVVTKFATAAGAKADLTADLAAADRTGTVFDVTGLGDQAGGVRGKLTPASAEGSLVTLRWRIGDTTWLLAVGAPNPVDAAAVRKLADMVVARVSKPSD